jgi:myo-inositol-1(or 4)-monophosphatase
LPVPDLDTRTTVARAGVREAGALAMRYFKKDVKTWDKAENDPVSEADLAVDALLKETLLGNFPDDGWLSEESVHEREGGTQEAPDYIWVVDPIDGTRAFIDDKPHFTICVALVWRGKTQLGFVYNPASEEYFEAILGNGAICNDTPISVGDHRQLENCRMIGYRDMYADRHWRKPWPNIEIAMVNSIAYRVVLVANGTHDACINLKPQNDWDIAAAELILREAGGICTNRQGASYKFHGQGGKNQNVIAANPVLQKKLLRKLEEFEPRIPKKAPTPGGS